MGANITLAGENLIAQKHAANAGLKVARFIFANVPGLDTSGPVDRAASKPVAAQIVHVHQIPEENAGYVNPNQVVYSSQIGSDVGDWDFNWIGLETDEAVLFAVAYVPVQQKRRNIPPLQIGNNLTRNFLVVFDGAQALTGITIDARTWQHDFTVRLAGIDERERQSNRDVFGRACFFGSSLQVEKVGSAYQVKPGTAYVEGIRVERTAALPIVPPALPTTAWLDVALQRQLSDVAATWQVVFGPDKADYTDSVGVRHYCVPIADLTNANTLTDRRSVEPITGPIISHFAARIGDYAKLRARATTKDDIGLGNLPNAKSDNADDDSSDILATTKAIKKAVSRLSKLELLAATSGTLTYALPASNAEIGPLEILLRRTDVTSNTLIIAAAGTDKIMLDTTAVATGKSSTELLFAGDWLRLRSEGAGKWWCVGQAQLPGSIASGFVIYSVTGIFSYAVPPVLRSGRKKAKVTVVGAGGGASRGGGGTGFIGGGGGGGGAAIGLVDLTGVVTCTVSVGAGGKSAANGGASSFATYLSASGGFAGGPDTAGGYGGKGAGGDFNIAGNDALDGRAGTTAVGADGSGGGSIFAGSVRSGAIAGATIGKTGQSPGAGGASATGATAAVGGFGADGAVLVEW